jgi:hypothetical protein
VAPTHPPAVGPSVHPISANRRWALQRYGHADYDCGRGNDTDNYPYNYTNNSTDDITVTVVDTEYDPGEYTDGISEAISGGRHKD